MCSPWVSRISSERVYRPGQCPTNACYTQGLTNEVAVAAASTVTDPSGSRPVARIRPLVARLIVVLTVQALFTAAVRLYVVPKLTPAVHMHSGLQVATDSEYF